MPWNPQGGGGGQGPWGRGPQGPQPPDIEEIIRRGQDRVKNILPGGFGGGRAITLVVLVALVLWGISGFYRVEPDELGVELVFGKMVGTTKPGLNYNWPTPVGAVILPKVTRINRVDTGFVGTTSRGVARSISEESLMLTGDENIIDIKFSVFWKIDTRPKEDGNTSNLESVRNFLFNIRNPELTVKNAAESAMREIIGRNRFEFARTDGRAKIAEETKALVQEISDRYGAGVEITSVQILEADPPQAVIDAFRDVQVARADMERKINVADAYKNEVVQGAQGEAAKIVRAAEGYREQKINIANGEAERFTNILKEYQQNPEVTRRRMYLETMKNVLKDMEKTLIENPEGGTGVVPYLPLDQLRSNANRGAAQ